MGSPVARALMPTLAAGNNYPALLAQRGWTLLELLVVLGILAMVLGMVVQSVPPSEQRRLQREAATLLAHLEAARATALTQGRPVWLVPTANGWELRHSPSGPTVLHRMVWEPPGPQLLIMSPPAADALRIGPDPVMPLYELQMLLGERTLVLHNPTVAGFEVRP
jgi:prepilin-type N-terminal cleavage/methylation domain-containing protein